MAEHGLIGLLDSYTRALAAEMMYESLRAESRLREALSEACVHLGQAQKSAQHMGQHKREINHRLDMCGHHLLAIARLINAADQVTPISDDADLT